LNFLLIATICTKLLQCIDTVNKVIQTKGGTIDVAASNIRSLVEQLQVLRNTKWEAILREVLLVAKNIGWPSTIGEEKKRGRKRKRSWDKYGAVDLDFRGKGKRTFYIFQEKCLLRYTGRNN